MLLYLESCALRLPVDGSKDGKISFFKEGKKCEALIKWLDCFIKKWGVLINPFVRTGEEVTEAAPELVLIEDDDDDVNIEDI